MEHREITRVGGAAGNTVYTHTISRGVLYLYMVYTCIASKVWELQEVQIDQLTEPKSSWLFFQDGCPPPSSARADSSSSARRASTSPVSPDQYDADQQAVRRRLLRRCGGAGNGRAGVRGQETLRCPDQPREPWRPEHGGQVLPRVQPPFRAPPPARGAVLGHLLPARLAVARAGDGATAGKPGRASGEYA